MNGLNFDLMYCVSLSVLSTSLVLNLVMIDFSATGVGRRGDRRGPITPSGV